MTAIEIQFFLYPPLDTLQLQNAVIGNGAWRAQPPNVLIYGRYPAHATATLSDPGGELEVQYSAPAGPSGPVTFSLRVASWPGGKIVARCATNDDRYETKVTVTPGPASTVVGLQMRQRQGTTDGAQPEVQAVPQ